jgi:hypothetical protein
MRGVYAGPCGKLLRAGPGVIRGPLEKRQRSA